MGLSDQWCTPPVVASELESFFDGPVDVDPCSNDFAVVAARRRYSFGGLLLPWGFPGERGTAFENFPYSAGAAWGAKAIHEMKVGNVQELVRLSPMSTSTEWWADICTVPARNPRILALKKIAFLVPGVGTLGKNTCRFEPALMYFGPQPDRFTTAFRHLTRWTTWGR